MFNQLQLSHQTKENRFPKIMESAKKLKPDAKRILSFGCSTGEEVFTLSNIFPESEIVGVDLDYWSINRARQSNKNPKIHFHTHVGGTGKYDLITCFMVLFALEKPIEYENWEEAIKIIDNVLNPNGLLMLYTSEYDLSASSVFHKYDVTRSWKRKHNRNNKEYYCGYYKKMSKINEIIEGVSLLAG